MFKTDRKFTIAVSALGLYCFLWIHVELMSNHDTQPEDIFPKVKPKLQDTVDLTDTGGFTSGQQKRNGIVDGIEKASDSNYSHGLNHINDDEWNRCLAWCKRGVNATKPYFLSVVLLVRIYKSDPAKLTGRELRHWLRYLRFAGVEHVYVYDAYVTRNESQKVVLNSFINGGYVTYIDWSHKAYPYTIAGTQVAAYQNCIKVYGKDSEWQAAIDIDEYPFSPNNLNHNFLAEFIKSFSRKYPHVGEITMGNYLFLGKPLPDDKFPLLYERIWRRTPEISNGLVKPIYKPSGISRASVHHNSLRAGYKSRLAPKKSLRMNHYWGGRLQNWGEDTPEILGKTIEDYSMKSIVDQIRACEQCLGRSTLYEPEDG